MGKDRDIKNILITGATGYVGAKLCLLLSKNKNYNITALSRKNKHDKSDWYKSVKNVIIGDIRDVETIRELAKMKFEIIIHLVSLDHHKSEDNPNDVASVNVLPTWNLLNEFSNNGSLKKFIYFSTVQVYGKVPLATISEEFIPIPQNAYGLTHLMSEQICNYYNTSTDINCINVRLSNSYGSPVFFDNNCWWLVINDLCKTAFYEKKIMLISDGSPQRDFIHSSDVYNAVDFLIQTEIKNFHNNTYNISSGETLTILELAHIVKSVYKSRYEIEIEIILPDKSISDNPNKYLNSERYTVDNKKIKSLGFISKTSMSTGINEIFEYLDSINNEK